MTQRFKLYPQEQRWWSFQDYQAVLDAMAKTGAKRILEFGPGSSTLALIEAGAEHIECCEDDPQWGRVYQERLADRFPGIVTIRPYTFADPLEIPDLVGRTFDMALIDGPRGTENRPVVLRYVLTRCRWVLMCCEEWQTRAWLRPIILEAAHEAGRPVEFTVTGPLSGAFALIGPKEAQW